MAGFTILYLSRQPTSRAAHAEPPTRNVSSNNATKRSAPERIGHPWIVHFVKAIDERIQSIGRGRQFNQLGEEGQAFGPD